MPTVFIDIETAPSQLAWAREELSAGIRPPAVMKKAETIAAWERDEKPAAVEDAWLKTSFDGALGQVVAIGYAVDNAAPRVLCVDDLSRGAETDIVFEFFDAMARVSTGTSGRPPTLVGHNIVGFDLPFLWKRAVVLGVKPPFWWPRDVRPWSDQVFDTMTRFAGNGNRISLDRLCRVLDLEGKGDGPTGADVWPMVQAGQWSDIARYCGDDVERTRAVFKRMTFTVDSLEMGEAA